jgi:hypothetical protein
LDDLIFYACFLTSFLPLNHTCNSTIIMSEIVTSTEEGPVICRMFRNSGKCRFKTECRFEHSEGPKIAAVIRARGLCHLWTESDGECKYGDRCRYFHGDEAGAEAEAALKRQNQAEGKSNSVGGKKKRKKKKKDKMCDDFKATGACEYADTCRYKHGPDDTRDLIAIHRSRRGPCYSFAEAGECQYGDECRFQH